MDFFAAPYFSDASLENTEENPFVRHAFSFSVLRLFFFFFFLLAKVLYLFRVMFLLCAYFAFSAILGLYKQKNDDAG